MRYRSSHVTTYVYEAPVTQCLSQAHLIPRTLPTQHVSSSSIVVEPAAVSAEHRIDYFGNHVSLFSILDKHDRLVVTSNSVVDVNSVPVDHLPRTPWEEVRTFLSQYPDEAALQAFEFIFDSPFVATSAELEAYGAKSLTPGVPIADAAIDLLSRIHKDFKYSPDATSIDMPLADVLKLRQGVCQDFAHVMIGVLRSYGLSARYVSGYLRSGAKYQGAEASHAWVSVFIPGHGWLDVDPTNNVIPSDGHITVAWGRDYGDVTPVKGVSLGGGAQTVDVEVRVIPDEQSSDLLSRFGGF
jgi:transglutaminase-like putative cysteine protease